MRKEDGRISSTSLLKKEKEGEGEERAHSAFSPSDEKGGI